MQWRSLRARGVFAIAVATLVTAAIATLTGSQLQRGDGDVSVTYKGTAPRKEGAGSLAEYTALRELVMADYDRYQILDATLMGYMDPSRDVPVDELLSCRLKYEPALERPCFWNNMMSLRRGQDGAFSVEECRPDIAEEASETCGNFSTCICDAWKGFSVPLADDANVHKLIVPSYHPYTSADVSGDYCQFYQKLVVDSRERVQRFQTRLGRDDADAPVVIRHNALSWSLTLADAVEVAAAIPGCVRGGEQ